MKELYTIVATILVKESQTVSKYLRKGIDQHYPKLFQLRFTNSSSLQEQNKHTATPTDNQQTPFRDLHLLPFHSANPSFPVDRLRRHYFLHPNLVVE